MAMLVLLESLSPAERTAFVLREVLGLPYGEVSEIVGRTEVACRQLVTRARADVRQRAPRFTLDHAQPRQRRRRVPRRVLTRKWGTTDTDPGPGRRPALGRRGQVAGIARRPVVGSHKVARLLALAARHDGTMRCFPVNGSTGLIFESGGEAVGVMGFAVAGEHITEIDLCSTPTSPTSTSQLTHPALTWESRFDHCTVRLHPTCHRSNLNLQVAGPVVSTGMRHGKVRRDGYRRT